MKTRRGKNWKVSTRAVHAGEDRWKPGYAVTTPISQTSTFVFPNTREIQAYTSKKKFRFEYARYGTPTQRAAEEKIASLDGAESTLIFSSGMNAVTAVFFALLSSGDHVVFTHDIYKKTLQFIQRYLPRFGVDSTLVPMGDYPALERAIRPETRLIFTESPTNPYLLIADLKRVARIGRKRRVLTAIDSTFATPVNQRPLDFGIDLVVHSATKYLSGHNDILAGAVSGREKLIQPIRDFQKTTGGSPDPNVSYLLIRGLKTLALRVAHQNQSALKVARFLKRHPKIKKVYYPGLPEHPHHRIAKTQMKGFGGVVSFDVRGGLKDANRFLNRLALCYIAPSLGGTETLITHPATVTYYDMSRKERYALGMTDTLIRLAVGVEDPEDIIADLGQALG